jgi:basic membrane lipoprotein Med (substrate-binding protein (PBP1-ABC) superfamily)
VRAYTNFRACLLTGARGVADPAAAPAWAGMQSASLATRAKVSYLAVSGPQTEANAATFVASLVVQQCDVVIGAGVAEGAAVIAGARQFRTVRFAVVGTSAGPVAGAASNVAVIAGDPAEVRSGVAGVVAQDASGA